MGGHFSSYLFFLPLHFHNQPKNNHRTYNTPIDHHFTQHKDLPPPPIRHAFLSLSSSHPLITSNRPNDDELLSSPSHNRKILIVGDIHGCYDEFLELLEDSRRRSNDDDRPFDAIISVGDLCNKGPHSTKVIKYIRSREDIFVVRGNHDDGALRAALGDENSRYKSKYAWIFEDDGLSDDDVIWLSRLPYTITIPGDKKQDFVVVHAGLIPDVKLEDQEVENLLTLRDVGRNKNGMWVDATKNEVIEAKPWGSLWRNDRMKVIFGHDAKRGIQKWDLAIGLDSGACYGKELTGIIIPEGRLVSVKARKIYCPIKGVE